MKKIIFFLFSINLLCLFYFLALGRFNRPALDDYCVMALYHDYGIFNSVAKWYIHWQARFSAHLLNNLVLKSYELSGTLFHFTLLLYAGFIAAFYRLSKILLPLWKEEKWLLLNISAIVLNLFLFFNFEFSTFYWVNVSTMYFGGLLAALFVAAEVLNEKKTIRSLVIIFFVCIYAGSSGENFSVTFFIMTGLTGIHFFRKSDKRFNKAIFALVVIAVSMTIMLLAPGTAARRSMFPVQDFSEIIITSLKAMIIIMKLIIKEKWIYLLLLSLPAFYISRFYPATHKISLLKLIKLTLAFICFIWICLLPTAYAMGEPGPLRAHTHIAFYIVLFSLFLFYGFWKNVFLSEKMNTTFYLIISLVFLSLICYKAVHEIPAAFEYARMEDRMVEVLREEKSKGRNEWIELKAGNLPEDMVYKPNTLSSDTSFFANNCICRYFNLDFPVSEK